MTERMSGLTTKVGLHGFFLIGMLTVNTQANAKPDCLSTLTQHHRRITYVSST